MPENIGVLVHTYKYRLKKVRERQRKGYGGGGVYVVKMWFIGSVKDVWRLCHM